MNFYKDKYFFELGYNTFGPILSGYLSWIISQSKEFHIDAILCASRDGFIVNNALNKIEPEIEVSYFYTSRLASVIPLLSSQKDIFTMLNLYKSWPDEFNVSLILFRLGVVISKKKLLSIGIDSELKLKKCDIHANNKLLVEIFEIFKEKIYENSNKQKKLLLKYLSPFRGKRVGFVDLGSGTILSSLIIFCKENNLEIEFFSFYFQSNNSSTGFCDMTKPEVKALLRMCYILLEIFFSAPHTSVIKYKEDKIGTITPIFSENLSNNGKVLFDLHSGAMSYLDKYYRPNYCQNKIFSGLYNIGLYPKSVDLENLGKIQIDSNLFNEHLLFPISFKTKNILKKLKSSLWLSGQLRLFGIPRWIIRVIYTVYYIKYKLTKN